MASAEKGATGHYVKQNKSDSERQILHLFSTVDLSLKLYIQSWEDISAGKALAL